MNADEYTETIELLRLQLLHQVKEGNFSDKRVVKLSQELDIYIVEYQRLMSSAFYRIA